MMFGGPFGAGFIAPLSALLILLGLIAAGLWAAVLGGKDTGRLPLSVLAGLLAGALLLEFGLRLPYGWYVVPGAVVILACLVVFLARLPAMAALLMGVLAGLWFGQTGAGPAGDRPIVWAGFLTGSLTAVAAGVGFAAILVQAASTTALRVAGGAIAAVGVLVFLNVL